jgi:hypothetical protein
MVHVEQEPHRTGHYRRRASAARERRVRPFPSGGAWYRDFTVRNHAFAVITLAGVLSAGQNGLCRSGAEPAPASAAALTPALALAADAGKLRTLHRGRAGIYYRLSERETGANARHPLVDAVVIGFGWREVEPRKGRFDFSSVRRRMKPWVDAGKGVVLRLTLYGQEVEEDRTPPWIYDEGVTPIELQGGGVAKKRMIRIPKVWDEDFVDDRLKPLVAAFAKEFDGDKSVWYVMPGFGHIGNINAQPSKLGADAMRRAGWTPKAWRDYCLEVEDLYQDRFERTPLIVMGGTMLLRDRRAGFYADDADAIVEELGRRGAAVITLGLDASASKTASAVGRLEPLVGEARQGATRLGIGDDWPLWVPATRRGKGPTRGYDENNLDRLLQSSLSGSTPFTILFTQEPEVTASNPSNRDYQRRVHDALAAARTRLFEADRKVFGR